MTFTDKELKGVPEGMRNTFTKRQENGETVYDVPLRLEDISVVVSRIPFLSLVPTLLAVVAHHGQL